MNRSACALPSADNPVVELAAPSVSATTSARALRASTAFHPHLTLNTTEVVDLTDSCPGTPLVATASTVVSSIQSRDGTPLSEASTIHLRDHGHGNGFLPECLDGAQWAVSEVLKIKNNHALVSWEPTVMASRDLRKTLGGIPLLSSARKAEVMGKGVLRIHWQPTWEPCKELCDCAIPGQHFDLDQGESVAVYPLTIEREVLKSAHTLYLVRLKPTFVTTKCTRALEGVFGMEDFDVEEIKHVSEETYSITWESRWVRADGEWAMIEWKDQHYGRRVTWSKRWEGRS